jgi:spermidine synthase
LLDGYKTNNMKKYSLEAAVFLCGASLMIMELAGSRALAPYVGTSLVVWTTLIGVVMGFLSLGYWYGGRLADRLADAKILSAAIFGSAVSVFLIIIINSWLLNLIQDNLRSVYVGSLLSTLLLFSLPSFLLGIVSPYAARLKMSSIDSSGSTVGNLYALSTLGSIAGTFSAGFFLIPFLGTTRVLYFVAITLVAVSLAVYSGRFFKLRLILAFLLVAGMSFSLWQSLNADPNKLVDVDTQYNRIWIKPGTPVAGRPVLNLVTDPLAVQSGMFLDKDDDLVFKYTKYYRLGDYFNPDIKQALIIGGAAYSYPKDFLNKHGGATLDVAEIDPGMTALAKKYFNLPETDRLFIYHDDGRVFLNRNKKKYDAIYIDAFGAQASIPYQLTTLEAAQRMYDSLSDDGVVMVNIISAVEGPKSKFLRAEYATYKEVFPQLFLFRVYPVDPSQHQNLMLVGLKKNWGGDLRADSAELKGYLDSQWRGPIDNDLPILTDDHAPVDYYTMSLL